MLFLQNETFLIIQSTLYVRTTHTLSDREQGVKQGEGRNITLGERHQIVHNQVDTGTISIHTLRWLLERAEERIWECPDCCDITPENS
jgi:hypothetical protein